MICTISDDDLSLSTSGGYNLRSDSDTSSDSWRSDSVGRIDDRLVKHVAKFTNSKRNAGAFAGLETFKLEKLEMSARTRVEGGETYSRHFLVTQE